MAQPAIGHRTAEFSKLWQAATGGVENLLGAGKVFLFSNPATGVWEAAVRNTVVKGALNLVNGAFSAKWHQLTASCGLPCEALEKSWGAAIHPDEVDAVLATGKFDVVTLVHNETSTGVMSPLQSIAELMQSKYPDIILHVDTVSSMTAVPVKFNQWGLGSCFASVQKAWALPPGFSVCAVSERVLERSAPLDGKGYYFDMLVYNKYYQKRQTPTTPSLPHIYGLKAVLEDIAREGLEARYQRHAAMAATTRAWALNHGQSLYAEKGFESITLTSIRNDLGWDLDALHGALLAAGYRMDRGYGRLRGEVFRIAHMGAVTSVGLAEFLDAFDAALAELGVTA
jgi:aspartate aminotransferase-like enzyme